MADGGSTNANILLVGYYSICLLKELRVFVQKRPKRFCVPLLTAFTSWRVQLHVEKGQFTSEHLPEPMSCYFILKFTDSLFVWQREARWYLPSLFLWASWPYRSAFAMCHQYDLGGLHTLYFLGFGAFSALIWNTQEHLWCIRPPGEKERCLF